MNYWKLMTDKLLIKRDGVFILLSSKRQIKDHRN
nr:MAG TPA: hypothetical protein [Bacteriophage sp.]